MGRGAASSGILKQLAPTCSSSSLGITIFAGICICFWCDVSIGIRRSCFAVVLLLLFLLLLLLLGSLGGLAALGI
jgi:hypothetical protein